MHRFMLAAGLLLASPALAQGTVNRSFTGSALLYTPSRVQGCDVVVMEAATYAGQVTVTLRNAGALAVEFTLSGELAGNGLRSIGTATVRLPRGQNIRVGLMRAHAGFLAESVLTLRGAACALRPA